MKIIDFFRKRKDNDGMNVSDKNQSKQYNVLIPDEKFYVGKAYIDDKIHICTLNVGIMDLNHKDVFGWYLSLIIRFDKTVGHDMPTSEESVKMQDFCDKLSSNLAIDKSHPNALLLGRITGNGQTQIMWYVHNPEIANDYLQNVISSGDYPFQFDYEMTFDGEWNEAHYWLSPIDKE